MVELLLSQLRLFMGYVEIASNTTACLKIFKIKGRPSFNPLIVHVLSFEEAKKFGEFNEDAHKLAREFWPGPISIVVPLKDLARNIIATCVLAGNTTVALRVPSHQIAHELLLSSNCAIAAPSAHPSGYVSSTLSNHVVEHFKDEEVFIIEDDSLCEYGLESTIIDCSTDVPTILRYGFITPEAISLVIGKVVEIAKPLMQIKAPGCLINITHHTRSYV